VIRIQARYARIGVAKFNDEARRMGRQLRPGGEVRNAATRDSQINSRMLRDAKIEGVRPLGRGRRSGLILKQMREMGNDPAVFGGSRLAYRNWSTSPVPPRRVWSSLRPEPGPARTPSGWRSTDALFARNFTRSQSTTLLMPTTG